MKARNRNLTLAKNLCFAFCLVFLFVAAGYKSEPEKDNEDKIPEGAIKIEYIKGHINMMIKFENGTEGVFIYDTGAESLYFDSTFYVTNGFNFEKMAHGRQPGAGTNFPLVKLIVEPVKFMFSGIKMESGITPIIDFKEILGDRADGIIGKNVFKDSVVEVNFQKNYVKLYSTIKGIDVTSYQKIKMENINNRFLVPLSIKINDSLTIEEKFVMDLGCTSSICFTNEAAQKYEIDKFIHKKASYYTEYGGVGGNSQSVNFKSENLKIGDFTINGIIMSYSKNKTGALSKNYYSGLLGCSILERFDIIIDYANCNLYIKPNEHLNDTDSFSTLGFSFIDRKATKKAWIVTGLYEGLAAEKAGLRINDSIIKVNGISIDSTDYNIFKKSDTINLEIKSSNGQIKNIKFPKTDKFYLN